MAVQNSLAKSQQRFGISAYLTQDAVKKQINDVIGGKDGQRFISAIVSAVNVNPALQECTNQSILAGALLGESLKLSPSPQLGQYYLVPYNDKERGKVAQFQLGYKGYIQLAIRSGQYKKLNVLAIKEGELVRFDPLNEEIEVNLIQDEEEREAAPTIGYYAMFEYTNGFRKAIYWSKEKMLNHANKFSAAFSLEATHGKYPKVSYGDYVAGKYDKKDEWLYSSFWYKNFDGMAIKTMLRQLISKWGIMSIDMMKAFDSDMAVINDDGSKIFVDNDADVIDPVDVSGKEISAPDEEPKQDAPAPDAAPAPGTPNDAASALFG